MITRCYKCKEEATFALSAREITGILGSGLSVLIGLLDEIEESDPLIETPRMKSKTIRVLSRLSTSLHLLVSELSTFEKQCEERQEDVEDHVVEEV